MRISDFFRINKSDRSVFLFFLSLLVLGASILFFLGGRNKKTTVTVADSMATDSILQRNGRYPYVKPRPYRTDDGRTAELFAFDPNTADSTQLLRLGPGTMAGAFHI